MRNRDAPKLCRRSRMRLETEIEATRTSLHGNLPTLGRPRFKRDLADSLQMARSGCDDWHFATVNFRIRSEIRLDPCAARSNELKSPRVSNALAISDLRWRTISNVVHSRSRSQNQNLTKLIYKIFATLLCKILAEQATRARLLSPIFPPDAQAVRGTRSKDDGEKISIATRICSYICLVYLPHRPPDLSFG